MSDATTPQPFDAATLSTEELTAEYTRIQTRGAELSGKSEFADGEVEELSELVTRVDAVQAEIATREQRATELSAAREKFATKPAEPVVEAAPVVEPTTVQKSDEPVAVPSVSELAKQTPTMPAKQTPNGEFAIIVSADAAGVTGKRAGEEFEGFSDVAQALIKSTQQYGRVGGGAGSRHAIAQFKRTRGEEFTVERPEAGMEILRHARTESRLHGGSLAKQWQHNIDNGASLTAAAGWCAPSENRYDVCRLWGSGVGMLDVPTITVRRGGLNYTDDPSFADIYANAVAAGGGSNFLTEAQVIADTAKTCSEVPCPTFENRRLDVLALCIRVSFLQAAGYPELVNNWVDGLIEANAQEMNRLIIADMVARAGAATVFDSPGAGTDSDQDSFTSALLAATELAAEDIRYQQGMPLNATIEIVLPHWVLPQMRADLSRRTRDNLGMLGVTDSQIASLFSARNLRVQFVRGYQDGLIAPALVPTLPGGDATAPYLTALPSSVNFLAYPAGAVAVARQDVVTLTNVYDAASLATNEFTRLFAEEGFAPVYPCPGLRQYTVSNACVGGTVGAANIACEAVA